MRQACGPIDPWRSYGTIPICNGWAAWDYTEFRFRIAINTLTPTLYQNVAKRLLARARKPKASMSDRNANIRAI